MVKFTFVCNACGTIFEQEVDEEKVVQSVECPKCHSHETQIELSLSSVYGYREKDGDGCSSSGFR